ncbi:MAG: aminomethyl-transferring glycine dehydrogenase subunit GcvPA [Clostridia bacterium]|nr:aminomethyl-transferring glycine dehydrogenase subunit GcvPA [Clostridia bacterium]
MNYIPQTKEEQKELLCSVGIEDVRELFDCIPKKARLKALPDLKPAMTEPELIEYFGKLASKNRPAGLCPSFLGAGVYDHYVPAVIDHVLSRQEFYTAYTPYQPEISQGTLTAIFEYQTMICRLTGLDVSNAGLYDSAMAAAETMLMAAGATKRNKIYVAKSVNPELSKVLETYAQFKEIKIEYLPYGKDGKVKIRDFSDGACVIVQSPNFFGVIEDIEKVSAKAHEGKALSAVCADPLSLALLKTPGEAGADIAFGETQSLGLKMSFGGPYCGYMAVREALMRKMPGRIVGQTVDTEGRRAFVLTLQAREQHIRREKATSNICSNQALCALANTVYLSLLGPEGLCDAASQSAQKAAYLCDKLCKTGKFEKVFTGHFFREFAVRCKGASPAKLNSAARKAGFVGGYELKKSFPELSDCLLLAVTEKRTRAEIDEFAERMARV